MCVRECMCVYTYVYIYVCVYVGACVYIHVSISLYICMYKPMMHAHMAFLKRQEKNCSAIGTLLLSPFQCLEILFASEWE